MFGGTIPPAIPAGAENGAEGLIVLGILVVLVAACVAIVVPIRRRRESAKLAKLVLRPQERKAA